MKANQFLQDDQKGYTNLLPIAITIVICFALLFIGVFVAGEIRESVLAQYPAAATRSQLQNQTVLRQTNLSVNYDSAVDIVQIVIIITLLAAAIGAIFLFTRFGR